MFLSSEALNKLVVKLHGCPKECIIVTDEKGNSSGQDSAIKFHCSSCNLSMYISMIQIGRKLASESRRKQIYRLHLLLTSVDWISQH